MFLTPVEKLKRANLSYDLIRELWECSSRRVCDTKATNAALTNQISSSFLELLGRFFYTKTKGHWIYFSRLNFDDECQIVFLPKHMPKVFWYAVEFVISMTENLFVTIIVFSLKSRRRNERKPSIELEQLFIKIVGRSGDKQFINLWNRDIPIARVKTGIEKSTIWELKTVVFPK